MPFRIVVDYEIFGSTKTNPRPKWYGFTEALEFEIPDISSFNAPVAVEWSIQKSPAEGAGLEEMQHTRWHSNRHWLRICSDHFGIKGSSLHTINAENMSSILEDRDLHRNALHLFSIPTLEQKANLRYAPVSADPRGRFTQIKNDGREQIMEACSKAFDNLLFIEGNLYQRCFEPFLKITLQPTNSLVSITRIVMETRKSALWHDGNSISFVLGLLQQDRLKQLAGTLDQTTSMPPIPSMNIHLPESLAYQWDVTFSVASKARKILCRSYHARTANTKILEQIFACEDPDQQFELLSTLDMSPREWQDDSYGLQIVREMHDILENRPVSMDTPMSVLKPRAS